MSLILNMLLPARYPSVFIVDSEQVIFLTYLDAFLVRYTYKQKIFLHCPQQVF